MSSSSRKLVQRAKANGTYEAILQAAMKVFARGGISNSKGADGAKEAGGADGTVYLYWKNKDDLLVAIFNHVAEQALAQARNVLAELEDPADKLNRISAGHLDMYARDRNLAIVFQVEL